MTESIPSWRSGVTPHNDIQQNRVSEALFAVNLSRAIAREGAAEYRDPALFFERTHLTRTLQSLVRDVLGILSGRQQTNSVLHLQTNFGGGKTHAELALYHLLTSPQQALANPRLAAFLRQNGYETIPQAAVAALPCADLDAGGRQTADSLRLHTLWGELAYRLGGAALYEIVRESDERRSPPGVETLRRLLDQAGPNLILVDELLHYVDKAAAIPVGSSNLASQVIGFLRELTEAVDVVAHSVLVVSLTASRMEDITVLTEEQALFTQSKMEDILRRVEDTRTPIEKAEIYEVVRVRLFAQVDESLAARAAEAYHALYLGEPWRDQLPGEAHDPAYADLLRRAYPFHPSIIQVLYERWGSRPQFQLTRGVLRFLAHLLAHLWQGPADGLAPGLATGLLIHPLDADLSDDDVRGEALRVAGSAWEAVIGADIAQWQGGGETLALAQRLDADHGGLYRRLSLVQGVATSVFLYTHGGLQSRPTPRADLRLAAAQPGLPLADLNQAFDDCKNRLYFFYDEEGGFIFKTEPNPNKVLADERSNIHVDDARLQVEKVVGEVLGQSNLFTLSLYGFQGSRVREPGDVSDDARLQLVILPPRLTLSQGRPTTAAAEALHAIANNYGKKHRMNRNRVLFLAPDSGHIAGASERATDWLAAESVQANASLMSRFSESQREIIAEKRLAAINDVKDYIRKAYNTLILPGAVAGREFLELSYIPPNKSVMQQVEEDLIQRGKLHRQFNPDLFEGRWESLWLRTAMVITTEDLWDKFARREDAPILLNLSVLQESIRQGVERELFGYGVLRAPELDKLQAASYEHGRVYFGSHDAAALDAIAISHSAVLLRRAQVQAQFPAITPEEVGMVFQGQRQTLETTFWAARRSQTVQGMVYEGAFFQAVLAGVQAGLFGYAASAASPLQRGSSAELSLADIHFSGWLIGEDVPLPVSVEEIARLAPSEGRMSVQELYRRAVEAYGDARVSEQALLNALQRGVRENRFGCAAGESDAIAYNLDELNLGGFIGQPAALPPDTRLIRLSGTITAVELASILQAAAALSRLGESTLHIDLRLELRGEVANHPVTVALNQLRQRVQGLRVEDSQ